MPALKVCLASSDWRTPPSPNSKEKYANSGCLSGALSGACGSASHWHRCCTISSMRSNERRTRVQEIVQSSMGAADCTRAMGAAEFKVAISRSGVCSTVFRQLLGANRLLLLMCRWESGTSAALMVALSAVGNWQGGTVVLLRCALMFSRGLSGLTHALTRRGFHVR